MATQLEIGDAQLADLRRVCDLGVEQLKAVAEKLDNLQQQPIRPDELVSIVRDTLGQNGAAAESICRQALSLNGLVRQAGLELEKVISGLETTIEDMAEENSDFVQAWQNVKEQFLRIVKSRAAQLTAKAIDLSYDYANLFRRGRILTDIRPLFNKECDGIEGMVISYTLRLRYDNIAGDHDLSLAMDQRDLEQLLKECQKALNKGKTAKSTMASHKFTTFITGERNDG